MPGIRWFLALIPVAAVAAMTLWSAKTDRSTPPSRVPLIFNQDCREFFTGKFGPVTVETLDRYADSFAATGVTDLFINVNDQRTIYPSAVWESAWSGYDPADGPEQPFFEGLTPEKLPELDYLVKQPLRFHREGSDYGQRLLERSKHNGINAWISLRMNDGHFAQEPRHFFHSLFWKQHPEWRLPQGVLDYAEPAVRNHYLALVHEVCQRYDSHGIELDFMRFGHFFRTGEEQAGSRQMTEFVREVREIVRAAGLRRRHPLKLAVRVPARPWCPDVEGSMQSVGRGRA